MLTSAELRAQFLNFFARKDHHELPSSSLVPANDPTLLFTNAGMVQFKDVFLGGASAPHPRAVSSQRCVRAGGKHNDLDNVGYTARHHTFFEMLGNFSFGDYFKRGAIAYAWEFLTQEMALDPARLWVTIFDKDDEAADIWLKEIGVSEKQFSRIGEKDNFWSMGDVGPCGPCTEIFYDHGEHIPGGPPGSPDEDGDRYVEIWNLVFMQYDRKPDGKLVRLAKPSVDTGMGLERLAAVMQGVHNNYDTDLFTGLIAQAAQLCKQTDLKSASLRVIADHIRSIAFLLSDGVIPSNEGRGYVLRRIIRRAARHGHKLGTKEPFLHQLVDPLIEVMGNAYPDLAQAGARVQASLLDEEQRFLETLAQGMNLLEVDLKKLKNGTLAGETVFKLYDTYGFPVDLTQDIARERGFDLDMEGFKQAMAAQRARGRAAKQFAMDYAPQIDAGLRSAFAGYERTQDEASAIAFFKGSESVAELLEGDEGAIVLDNTPFYAESGGQVGDQGWLKAPGFEFQVFDTRKHGAVFLHLGQVTKGKLGVGERVLAEIDLARRAATVLNHSATHLLHAALREALGDGIKQKGSLVASDRLRFDFSHPRPVGAEELARIERRVNEQIRLNADAETRVMKLEDALKSGAMALFGEKYDSDVRVLRMGDFSTELCGGTHVRRVGDIGLFKIISEEGVAAGVRRIEAVTGATALAHVEENERRLAQMAGVLKTSVREMPEKLSVWVEKVRAMEKELQILKAEKARQAGSDLVSRAIEIDGVKVIAARLHNVDGKALRETADQLKSKLASAVIVLASVDGQKVSLVAAVTKDQLARVKAGDLVNSIALQVGGKGGGRPDLAQAGGTDPTHLDAALLGVPDWVRAQIA